MGKRRLAGRAAALAAAARRWSARELREMRALYCDKKVTAAALARLFKTTTSQVYRLARIHDWPHRQGGPVPNPASVRNLRPKYREIYYHLRPTIGHDAALAEAWRGAGARGRVEHLERVST